MSKRITSVLLVLVLVFALGTVAAFAADKDPNFKEDLENTGLSKTLIVADGIVIDDVDDYTFSFTPVGSSTADVNDHPAIADVSITTANRNANEATGTKTFASIFDIKNFTHAGEYIYRVVETTQAMEVKDDNGVVIKKLTVDGSKYNVRLFVVNGKDGLEFAGVIVELVKEDGTTEKVDPTIKPNEKENPVSGFNFTNKYTETVTDVKVTKVVTGAYADMTKAFEIKVTVIIPDVADEKDVVLAKDSTAVQNGLVFTAELKNGESIEFAQIPAGSKIVVEEAKYAGYTATVSGFVAKQGVVGEGVKTEESAVIVNGADHAVTVTNECSAPPATGVIIDSLPYVLLVVVALAGVVYLTLKKKAYDA